MMKQLLDSATQLSNADCSNIESKKQELFNNVREFGDVKLAAELICKHLGYNRKADVTSWVSFLSENM